MADRHRNGEGIFQLRRNSNHRLRSRSPTCSLGQFDLVLATSLPVEPVMIVTAMGAMTKKRLSEALLSLNDSILRIRPGRIPLEMNLSAILSMPGLSP